MNIKILDPNILPEHLKPSTEYSAGIDLRARIDKPIKMWPGSVYLFNTGISIAIPNGWCGLILPRSGLGHKHGLILGNGTGLIDADYRGEVKVSIWNRNEQPHKSYTIEPYERIAQLVVIPHYNYSLINIVDSLDDTVRGSNGFNSTGVK